MSHAKLSVLGWMAVSVLSCSVGAGKDRSYVSGNYSLVLDGVHCGFLQSAEGGGISAEVIHETGGSSYFVKKHIGPPRYEDFVMQIGLGMGQPIYDWIRQSWTMNYQRKSGSIVAMDHQLTPISERQFTNAVLTATTIPALDGSSKEPAYLTLKFAPEITRAGKPSGAAPAPSRVPAPPILRRPG